MGWSTFAGSEMVNTATCFGSIKQLKIWVFWQMSTGSFSARKLKVAKRLIINTVDGRRARNPILREKQILVSSTSQFRTALS